MKMILLLAALGLGVPGVFAQNIDSVTILRSPGIIRANDSREFKGFIIRITPASTGGHCFDILKNNKPSRHFQNPLPFSPGGVRKKEDAYKIAQWIIEEYERTGHWVNTIPPHVAKQLNIGSIN